MRNRLVPLLALLLSVTAVTAAQAQFAPGRRPLLPRFSGSTAEPAKPPVVFPELTGKNLAGEEIAFPKVLTGSYSLIFLISDPEQEIFFETWLPAVRKLADRYPNFRYFVVAELPPGAPKRGETERWPVAPPTRPILPEDEHARVVVPVRTDRSALHKTLEISDDSTLHILFVNGRNEVAWNDVGARTNGKSNALEMQMAKVASDER